MLSVEYRKRADGAEYEPDGLKAGFKQLQGGQQQYQETLSETQAKISALVACLGANLNYLAWQFYTCTEEMFKGISDALVEHNSKAKNSLYKKTSTR